MVHPALLRVSVAPASMAGWPPAERAGWRPLEPAKRMFRRLNRWSAARYRPERHYMRGGRTPGAKSFAAG